MIYGPKGEELTPEPEDKPEAARLIRARYGAPAGLFARAGGYDDDPDHK